MLNSKQKIAVYMEGHIDSDYGKMGTGVVRYLMNPIVAVIDKALAGRQMSEFMDTTKSVPILASLKEAISKGAEVLVLGIAPSGGRIPDSWNSVIEEALENGLSIVNGLHDLLQPKWQSNIKNPESQWIWDIRVPQFIPDIATGRAANLENKRVLFVGTDMAVGKMTAGLELYSWLQKEKVNVGFVATGQIGITITGKGIPLDAFKVDHACGAVEQVVMEQADKEIVLIEGQGSLLHPGSTATLPLMRGSCPTHLILCLRAEKTTLRSPEHIKIPDLNDFIALNESLTTVGGTFSKAKVIGIAANTSMLSLEDAEIYLKKTAEKTGILVTDPVRFGIDSIGKYIASS
ncbi:DUF1611 domain-containing protein [Flavobacteriaceae bacterium]|nr:DUF1611 domain-containing protein [Flavobacteriaceae bacterium]